MRNYSVCVRIECRYECYVMNTLLFLLSSYTGEDPGLVERGADKCPPKAYHPRGVRGHAPLEEF